MKKPLITPPSEVTPTHTLPKTPNAEAPNPPEAWQEFLEDEGDCCGGCNHKPR